MKRTKIGDKFWVTWHRPGWEELDAAMLCQVGYNMVCLISLVGGNRYVEPVKVKDVENITEREMEIIRADYPNTMKGF